MSQYTPVPAPLPTTIDIPDDNTKRAAAAVGVGFEASLDAIARLEKGWHQVAIAPVYNLDDRWAFDATDRQWEQGDVTSGGGLVIPVALPVGVRISALRARVWGGEASRTNLPETTPSIDLLRVRSAAAPPSVVGAAITDEAADATAYSAVRWIGGALGPFDLLETDTVVLEVHGESGTNSETGYRLLDLQLYVEPTPP